MENSGPVPIVVRSDVIVIEWEADEPLLADATLGQLRYDVYYRTYGTLPWNYLHSTDGAETTTQIRQTELGVGAFELAVEKILANKEKSDLHASSDFTAWPPGGWYVIWEAP